MSEGMKLTEEQLEEIRGRVEKITPPWTPYGKRAKFETTQRADNGELWGLNEWRVDDDADVDDPDEHQIVERDFIVNAATDIPALLAHIAWQGRVIDVARYIGDAAALAEKWKGAIKMIHVEGGRWVIELWANGSESGETLAEALQAVDDWMTKETEDFNAAQ